MVVRVAAVARCLSTKGTVMQLFFSPGASSLAPHIALREAGLPFELVRVDLEAGAVAATGEPFEAIHRMRKVPALRLDDGAILTETLSVLVHIADRDPRGALAPPPATTARHRMLEAMSFTATELHKGFAPMFDPDLPATYKGKLVSDPRPFAQLAALVERGPYVLGETFSIADVHLFTVLRMGRNGGLDFSPWPNVERFIERVARRPAVVQALRAEGVVEA
jgi:glutathione S-transferase